MKIRKISRLVGGLVMVFGFASWLSAQHVELNPYAGGLLAPNSVDIGAGSFDLKQQGIYGIRTGVFLTERFEIEGNFGYINHFELEDSDPDSQGYLWEASGIYRFDLEEFKPFVTVGLGGITTNVQENDVEFKTAPTPVLGSGDTVFTVSYGAGIKAPLLWGPVGLRGDLRARTLPNYQGKALTWMEVTGGLIFSEHVLLALTRKGVVRDEAYRMVQRNAMQVWEQGGDFPALLKQDKDIKKHLTDKEIDKAFDMKNHLKNVDKIFNRVFK